MNPEFQRNLWLELTPQRIGLMTGGLALAFFAAALPGGLEYGPSAIATFLFYLIVGLYGTRAAAIAVIGEIRDRTWDSQRLSSLGPGAMMWGKLLGATIYAWYGGAICLAVIAAGLAVHKGPAIAGIETVYYLAFGAIAQASAFLASLIAIHRRQSASRIGAFACQFVGLAAGAVVYAIWSIADPVSIFAGSHHVDTVLWWGRTFDSGPFLILSLAVFAGWILVGCYREMRLELQIKNGPFVWLAFLAFIGVYVAGFDAWLPKTGVIAGVDPLSLRLALATSTYLVATYVMVLLEPKDRVHYRWLLGELGAGRIGSALLALQAWMMSYAAAFAVAMALAVWTSRVAPGAWERLAPVAAMLGFAARDTAVFVFMQTLSGRRRADWGAIVVLIALYLLLPAILSGLKLSAVWFVLLPVPTNPVWLGPLVGWAEGLTLVALAFARVSLGDQKDKA